MKKFLCLITAFCVCAVTFTSCNKNKKVQEDKDKVLTLVMAEVNPEDSVCGRMDKYFKDKVEEFSEGKILVDVRYSGSLGDEKEVIKFMMAPDSSIDLARTTANLSPYGEKKSALISIPYTFVNQEHFWKFAESEIAENFLAEPYNLHLGVRGLCYAQEGFRNFFSTEKISSITEIKGRRMRVSGKTLTDLAVSLQAVPVNVPFTDLYMSLQTGETEIAEQPLSNYLSNSFYKVAPYVILDRHMLGAVQIMITSQRWDSLSPEQQDIIKSAALNAAEYCKILAEEQEVSATIKLVSEGVKITEVNDASVWQDACKEMIRENSKEYAELYQKILNLAD